MQAGMKEERISAREAHFRGLHSKIDNLDLLTIVEEIMVSFNLGSSKEMGLVDSRSPVVNHTSLTLRLSLVNLVQTLTPISSSRLTVNTASNQILSINLVSLSRRCRKHVNRFNLSSRQTRTVSRLRTLGLKVDRTSKEKNREVKDSQIEAVFKDLDSSNARKRLPIKLRLTRMRKTIHMRMTFLRKGMLI